MRGAPASRLPAAGAAVRARSSGCTPVQPEQLQHCRYILTAAVSPWTCRLGSCHLTGSCCQALATHIGESCSLSCLDLSDTELGAGAVLLLRQLRHPACPLQALG